MSKDELQKKLKSIREELEELRMNEGIWHYSALYALLMIAVNCIDHTMLHVDELTEKNP